MTKVKKSVEEFNHDAKRIHMIFNDKKLSIFECKNCEIEDMLSGIQNLGGLIILFEDGEVFENQKRIVFIGYSRNIRKRIQEYFYDRERNATLKRHVGDSLLNIEIENGSLTQDFLALWWDYKNEDRLKLGNYREVEERIIGEVQNHIKSKFSFVLLPVRNATHRRNLAWRLLSTLSHSKIKPSSTWLGNNSSHFEVKESGLWAMRTYKSRKFMEVKDFELLEKYMRGEM
mgnify:CR=1 FL=1